MRRVNDKGLIRPSVLCVFACALALGCGDNDADDSASDDSASDDSATEGDADADRLARRND